MTRLDGCCISLLGLLSGCVAYRRPDLPPIVDRPPTPVHIVVVVEHSEGSNPFLWNPWRAAGRFASALEEAGFVPSIVSGIADAPQGMPVAQLIEDRSLPPGCSINPVLWVLSFLTLAVAPNPSCVDFGYRFDLRPSSGSTIAHLDTRFGVPTLSGWLVSPLYVFPQFSASIPDDMGHQREIHSLRLAILDALEPPSDSKGR